MTYLSELPRFNTINYREKRNVAKAMRGPLSGYLGGVTGAGYWIERLSDEWKAAFNVPYAVPCNSATSGLIAACMAADIGYLDEVWTTPYTMSATAACAYVLGANVSFIDIEPVRYSINLNNLARHAALPKAIIVTNLFGHPAYLSVLRNWCDRNNVVLIEDNAQAPFAREGDHLTGTVGHMGVFSLNVHKHFQAGEGGVVVTSDERYAKRLQGAINHGELNDGPPGLNLRMTEPTAAIACSQLAKAPGIIQNKREIAYALTEMVDGITWIHPPTEDAGCRHVYYLWAAQVAGGNALALAKGLNERGFPVRVGYAPLLNYLFRTTQKCPAAAALDRNILIFEVCTYDPKARHLRVMRDIMHEAVGEIERGSVHEDIAEDHQQPATAIHRGGDIRQSLRVVREG